MRADRGDLPVKVGHSSRMACSCSVVSARVEQERLYVCMCVCMSVCIYGHVCKICIFMYAYIYTYVCIHVYVYICIYMYYIYTYITYVTGYDAISQAKSCQELNTTVTVITGWYTPNLRLNLSPVNSPFEVADCNVCRRVPTTLPLPVRLLLRNDTCHEL